MDKQSMLVRFYYSHTGPKSEDFVPTPTEPIKTVEIGLDDEEQPVYAYGVKTMFYGVTGPFLSPASTSHWIWHLDRETALRQANCDLWVESSEGQAWLMGDARHVRIMLRLKLIPAPNARVITPVNGAPFTVYRVLNVQGWIICTEDDVCDKLHASIWDADFHETPRFPDFQKDVLEQTFPDILERHYGDCPHCHERLLKYAYFHFEWRSAYYRFCGTREEAESKQAEHQKYFADRQVAERQRLAQGEAQKYCESSFSSASKLQKSLVCRQLSHYLPEARQRFDNCRYAVIGRDIEDYISEVPKFDELAAATLTLLQDLDILYEHLWDRMVENDWLETARGVLSKHLSKCPLCDAVVTYSDDFLEQLLVYGQAPVACNCQDKHWSQYDKDLPQAIKDLFAGKDCLPRCGTWEHGRSPNAREIGHIRINYKTAFTLICTDDYSPRFGLMVDTDNLRSAGKVEVDELVAASVEEARRQEIERREEDAQQGLLLKLRLSWSEQHQSWGVRMRDDAGTVVYSVSHRHIQSVESITEGWYYCNVVSEPPKAQKPGFRLALISVIAPIPAEHQPQPPRVVHPARRAAWR
ncbi:MAG: hypothetical protein WC766_03550 [Patescibacteria group bacterium]|jgi:hypothetical protein